MRHQAIVGAEGLRATAYGNRYRISRGDERATTRTAHHISGTSLPAHLFTQRFYIFDRAAQMSAHTSDRLHDIHDEAKDDQNDDTSQDETHQLPPPKRKCYLGFFGSSGPWLSIVFGLNVEPPVRASFKSSRALAMTSGLIAPLASS